MVEIRLSALQNRRVLRYIHSSQSVTEKQLKVDLAKTTTKKRAKVTGKDGNNYKKKKDKSRIG